MHHSLCYMDSHCKLFVLTDASGLWAPAGEGVTLSIFVFPGNCLVHTGCSVLKWTSDGCSFLEWLPLAPQSPPLRFQGTRQYTFITDFKIYQHDDIVFPSFPPSSLAFFLPSPKPFLPLLLLRSLFPWDCEPFSKSFPCPFIFSLECLVLGELNVSSHREWFPRASLGRFARPQMVPGEGGTLSEKSICCGFARTPCCTTVAIRVEGWESFLSQDRI